MKLKFLGTSSGWPSPRIGCKCPQCQSNNPKDKRWRSSLLVDNSVLIDAGPDAYHQFQKYKITQISALIISHAHPDHYLGIHDINPGKLYQVKSAPLFTLENNLKAIRRLFPENRYEEKVVKLGDTFKINDLEFQTFPVVHCLTYPVMGLVINKKVAYITDIRRVEKKYEKYLKNLDLAIFDGSCLDYPFPPWTNSWGHWTMKEAAEFAKKLKIKKLIFTHIGHKTKPHAELNQILKKYHPNVEVAYDGLEIEI